jgi:anti-anti-sigma factor
MHSASFELEHLRKGATSRLVLRGELDLSAAPRLREALAEAEAHGSRQIIVDLSRLQFVDSSGVHAFVAAGAAARANGHALTFVHGPAQVQRVLELSGLTGRLTFVDDAEER